MPVDAEGGWTGPAAVVETHISVLFFFGNRVYKLRKPVDLPFVDFSERTVRLADCRREVLLNQRLSRDVYLGVADFRLEGEPIEHAVVMRRLPSDRQLSHLVDSDGVIGGWIRRVAETLAQFHETARRSPEVSAAATAGALRAVWESNFSQTDRYLGSVLDRAVEAELRSLVSRWVDGRVPLLEQRIASQRVCDGHGDLQADDVYCLDDGIRILDCLEFSDRLRYGDAYADVAFLAMDLERLGHAELAEQLLSDYAERSADRPPASLVHYYTAARAYVRMLVSCLLSASDAAAADEARRLQALALDHLRRGRVQLVIVGGLPGVGKSTLAAGLGRTYGWRVLRSDEIRSEKRPEGEVPAVGYLEGRYSCAATMEVYRELLTRAEGLLTGGESVVLDASWTDAGRRDEARDLATRTSSRLVELCCTTSADVAEQRIEQRQGGADPSEATPAIRAAMERSMSPWPSAGVIDTTTTPDDALARAVRFIESPGSRPQPGHRSRRSRHLLSL